MPASTPNLATNLATNLSNALERARREKWTRLALLDPWNAGDDSRRKQQLREQGWPEESLLVVPDVDGEPADLVASVAQIGSLKELVIVRLMVGDMGAQAIAEHLPALTSLVLASNSIGEAGARAIAEHLHALTSLNLAHNDVGDAGARAIAEHLHALTSLNLEGNTIAR